MLAIAAVVAQLGRPLDLRAIDKIARVLTPSVFFRLRHAYAPPQPRTHDSFRPAPHALALICGVIGVFLLYLVIGVSGPLACRHGRPFIRCGRSSGRACDCLKKRDKQNTKHQVSS